MAHGLALDSATQLHLPLAGAALVHQLFPAVEFTGYSEEGTRSLLKALEALGNVRVESQTHPAI